MSRKGKAFIIIECKTIYYYKLKHIYRFSEKQLRLLNIKSRNSRINEEIGFLLQQKKVSENLRSSIVQKREKIAVLKSLMSETQEAISRDNETKKQLLNYNRTLRIKLPKYEDKVRELGDYVISKVEDIKKRRETYDKYESELKVLIRESIQKLVKYIFPIKRVLGKIEATNVCEISDLERDLAEATRNICSRERLEQTQESENDMHHIIVAPYLPGNGDYSDYTEWVMSNKDGVPANTGSNTDVFAKSNPAVRISAALTYTAQLLHVLSYYLDVRFPFKLVYSEFCSSMMSEQQLTRRVARLNANILYLCYTQRIKLSNLHPSHTLENILYLMNAENNVNLGRMGPVETSDCSLSKNLEAQLIEELDYGDETDSEDENAFPHEWEDVSHNAIGRDNDNNPMVTNAPNTLNPTQMPHGTASMAGGLMTSAAASIASIWRGWTTNR